MHTNMQNGTEVRWQMGELLTALAEEETGELSAAVGEEMAELGV